MLRHYDKIGLFKPSHTEQNGYRYYNDEDMYKISSIKELRRYEFSLQEIDGIINHNSMEYTKFMLQQKIEELKQSTTEHHYLVMEMEKQVRAIKGNDDILSINKDFDIMVGYRKNFLALCYRKCMNESEMELEIQNLYQTIEQSKHLIATGIHMGIFHQAYNIYDPNDTDIEVCIPVNKNLKKGEVATRVVDGGWYMSTVFLGSYNVIGTAYVALIRWAKENSYEIIGPTLEKYYKDGSDDSSHQKEGMEDSYVTEICIPIAPTKKKGEENENKRSHF